MFCPLNECSSSLTLVGAFCFARRADFFPVENMESLRNFYSVIHHLKPSFHLDQREIFCSRDFTTPKSSNLDLLAVRKWSLCYTTFYQSKLPQEPFFINKNTLRKLRVVGIVTGPLKMENGDATARTKYQIRTRHRFGPKTNLAQNFNYLRLVISSSVYKIFDNCSSS